MITLKKSELEAVLMTISVYSIAKENEPQTMIGGLLKENLTLGTKRKLQKIHKKVLEAYNEFVEDVKKLQEECKTGENDKKEPIYDREKLDKEVKELLDEEVKLEVDQIQISQIESVPSTQNYDFDIIEKIAV